MASSVSRASAGEAGRDGDDAAVAGGDVEAVAPVGQRRVADEEVEGHGEPRSLGVTPQRKASFARTSDRSAGGAVAPE